MMFSEKSATFRHHALAEEFIDPANGDATVAPILVRRVDQKIIFAVTHGFERARRNAELRHQQTFQRGGPPLGKRLVGFARSDRVRMAFDEEAGPAAATRDLVEGTRDLPNLAKFGARYLGR